MQDTGIFLLIKGVGRHAGHITMSFRIERSHRKIFLIQGSQNTILGCARLRTQRAAFQHLAHMVTESRIKPLPDPGSRKYGRVIGSAADYNIRSILQSPHHRLMTHLSHNIPCLIHRLLRKRGNIAAHRIYLLTADALLDSLLVHVRKNHRQLPADPVVPQDFINNIQRPFHMHPGACSSGRPDDHRNPLLSRIHQDNLQILAGRHTTDDADSCSQLVRACVGGAGIHHHHIRVKAHPLQERGFRKSIPQNPTGRQNTVFFHFNLHAASPAVAPRDFLCLTVYLFNNYTNRFKVCQHLLNRLTVSRLSSIIHLLNNISK